jgi:predicted ATPase
LDFVIRSDLRSPRQPNTVYLRLIDWDDWFKYATTYSVDYVDAVGDRHQIGNTKIGKFGLKPAGRGDGVPGVARHPGPPETFKTLPRDFFSVGQDSDFYEELTELGDHIRDAVLKGLRDVAFLPHLLEKAAKEDVTKVSLLRYVPLLTVQEQFTRLARGGARLTPYDLEYRLKYLEGAPRVTFGVVPESTPPTNIHVIVGRNGVGKSTFLNKLAAFHVKKSRGESDDSDAVVSNLVSVSFSAFDSFEPLSVPQDRTKGLTYHYVGLKLVGASKDEADRIKGPRAIASEMTKSARACLQGARRARWVRALRLLESDPIFSAAGIADAADPMSSEGVEDGDTLDSISATFKRLSSGHKLVLLTVTRLVETVSEKSLVLLDEPEAHLHPPLLSAFVRALSDLLVNRNGIAIMATHSPVVLQEVPRSCVWKIDRVGDTARVSRPTIETFGENVGTLTNEIFGLEVVSTGFHRILREVAETHATEGYEAALAAIGGEVGTEGRSILRSLVDVLGRQNVER